MSTLYPAQIDTTATLPTVIDNFTTIKAVYINQLRDAILRIEGALGVNPAGTHGTVANRLASIENSINNTHGVIIAEDLGGVPTAPLVIGMWGRPISSVQPDVGQVLTWNGLVWAPLFPNLNEGFIVNLEPPSAFVEIGQTVINPIFTATYNHVPVHGVIVDNQGHPAENIFEGPLPPFLAPPSGDPAFLPPDTFIYHQSYEYNNYPTIPHSVVFSLTVNDNIPSFVTTTTSITWTQRLYYGVASPGSSTASFIQSLSNNPLAVLDNFSFTANAGLGQAIYFAYRSAYGVADFWVNGFEGGFNLVSTSIPVTNAYGFTENYTLYQSSQVSLGITKINVFFPATTNLVSLDVFNPESSLGNLLGDVIGATDSNSVIRIQGTPVSTNSVANDGYALVSTGNVWVPTGVAPVFNVKNFGAKGDGIHDDSIAIQAAHNALPSTGGGILLSSGTYLINSTINFTKPVQLQLNSSTLLANGGVNTIINTTSNLIVTGNDPHSSILQASSGGTAIKITGVISVTEGEPFLFVDRVSMNGGAKFIDASLSPSFNGGLAHVDRCVISNTTDVAITFPDSFFYSKISNTEFVTCFSCATIGRNTETIFEDCSLETSSGSTAPAVTLNGPHHLMFRRCEFYGFPPNTSPDILINPLDSLGTGYTYVESCKFGAEREYWLNQNRNRIKIYDSGSPTNIATRIVIKDSEFFGPSVLNITSIGRSGGTTTATISCNVTSGHGLQVGDKICVMQVVSIGGDPAGTGGSFCGEHIVTAIGSPGITQTVSWADSGATVTQGSRGGVIGSLSTSAINLVSPMAESFIDGCIFTGFGYAINDSFTQIGDIRDSTGRCFYGKNNRIRGPVGYSAFEFTSGIGRFFEQVQTESTTAMASISSNGMELEPRQIQNRLLISDDLTSWGNLGITVTGSQADPEGGTSAFKIARQGLANIVFFNGTGYVLQEGLASQSGMDMTNIGHIIYLRFWAKAGTSTGLWIACLDGNGTIQAQYQIKLSSTWEEHELRIPLNANITPSSNLAINMAPGYEDAQLGDCYVYRFGITDFPKSQIIKTSGTAFTANTTFGTVLRKGLQAPTIDSLVGVGALGVGTNTSTTSVSVGRTGIISTINGTLDVTGTINISGLTASQAVVTDSSKNLISLQYDSAPTASTLVFRNSSSASNFLTVDTNTLDANGGSSLSIGTTNATSINIAQSGLTTTVNGFLSVNGTLISKGRRRNITPTTISYLILASDDIIAVGALSAGITVTLPGAPSVGDEYECKDTNGSAATNNITLDSGSGNKIDAAQTFVISANYGSITVVCTRVSPNQWSIV